MRARLPFGFSALVKQSQRWQRDLRKAMKVARKVSGQVQAASAPKAAVRTKARAARAPAGRLKEVTAFGSNPGRLRMLEFVPAKLKADSALVVVLHGCRQNASDYDRGSSWSKLARENGFAVVFAEQRPANNSNVCFNWFRPSAVARDRGELLSIRQMIDSMIDRHPIAPERIFVQGLSAGGAMAVALLATYPEYFAGGQIVGGLPYGAARDAMTALSVMKKGAGRSASQWGDLVRQVTPEPKRMPVVSVWHGGADQVVNIANAHGLVQQWLDVYGLDEQSGEQKLIEGRPVRRWADERGRPLVEYHLIDGLHHGLPVDKLPAGLSREAARFMLEAGVSASRYMIRHVMNDSPDRTK